MDLILTAAERVVMRDGVMRLTIEAVAREAKLSKGGVLYHLATKEALIQAMLERLIQQGFVFRHRRGWVCATSQQRPHGQVAPGGDRRP